MTRGSLSPRIVVAVALLAVVFSALVYGTIGYVALHFIRKVW